MERFPGIRPVKRAPALTTVNGIGLGMYGHRAEDPETGAYIKTHCFCFFFIPLFSFGAYRVVDSREGGWYFLGRESLSTFAKAWNALVGCLVLTGSLAIAWNGHINSPEYVAGRDLQAATAKLQSGDALGAAGGFAKLLTGPLSVQARPALGKALEACLRSDSIRTNAGAFRLLGGLGSAATRGEPLVAGAFQRGLDRINQVREKDPEGALQLLDAVSGLDPKQPTLASLRIDLLKELIAAHPDNLDRIVELALIYEKTEQLKEAQALLAPHRAKLGSSEGARILGQHLLQDSQYEEAYGLLYPYVQARLTRLHAIEANYTNAVAAAYRGAIHALNNRGADHAFYERYQQAGKAQQEEMVEDFVQKWMQTNPTYQRALAQLKDANQIVNVTLDLGIVQLNRAQSFQDSVKRKTELEAAEKTFLAIRGLAGETDEYRMFLGQVYYWLGRAAEGKELFDQLLAAKKRSYSILMALGRTLREVGEEKQARDLLEEAYRVGKAGRERYLAAGLRAVMAREIADKIAWLEKGDQSEPATQVALNGARGEQALEQGRKEAAAEFLRKAIAGY
ncbi:MAG TPA: hypothetical protein VNM37_17065, partial [Candidatus Dormibacteraeota bacterium]|nr:hypothetical protein [Candidatus Dormibacteraeota bacterium]